MNIVAESSELSVTNANLIPIGSLETTLIDVQLCLRNNYRNASVDEIGEIAVAKEIDVIKISSVTKPGFQNLSLNSSIFSGIWGKQNVVVKVLLINIFYKSHLYLFV